MTFSKIQIFVVFKIHFVYLSSPSLYLSLPLFSSSATSSGVDSSLSSSGRSLALASLASPRVAVTVCIAKRNQFLHLHRQWRRYRRPCLRSAPRERCLSCTTQGSRAPKGRIPILLGASKHFILDYFRLCGYQGCSSYVIAHRTH